MVVLVLLPPLPPEAALLVAVAASPLWSRTRRRRWCREHQMDVLQKEFARHIAPSTKQGAIGVAHCKRSKVVQCTHGASRPLLAFAIDNNFNEQVTVQMTKKGGGGNTT